MSISLAIAIYSALIAFVSSLMIFYFKVKYPQEEAKLGEKKINK